MNQGSRSSGKKAKVDVPDAGGQVKQEVETEGANGAGGGDAGAMVVVAPEGGNASISQIGVWFDKAKLDCPLCTLPLKPPIFQCDVGHLACSACHDHGQLSNNKCYACGRLGSYGRNPLLEEYILSATVLCPFDVYGCRAHIAYCDVGYHQRECPCAPCRCPDLERGCLFVGSPAMLLDHIAAEHAQPRRVTAVRYGLEWKLALTPPEQRWHALVRQEDRSLFLVSLGADTAVSLVCVRANAGGPAVARYTCRLAVELPSGGDNDDGGGPVVMESKVRSSALPGGKPAPDQRVFVGLHQQLQPGDMVSLSIRIDQLPPASAAAAATATGMSTTVTPGARSSSRKRN